MKIKVDNPTQVQSTYKQSQTGFNAQPNPINTKSDLRPGQPYYIERDRMGKQSQSVRFSDQPHHQTQNPIKLKPDEQDSSSGNPDLVHVEFQIDPSISKILQEHVHLSKYLRERFLTVDVFDGDSLFLWGSCKVPLYELLRQQRPNVVRAKECEMCDPATGEDRGALQIIMTNVGRLPQVYMDPEAKGSPEKRTLN